MPINQEMARERRKKWALAHPEKQREYLQRKERRRYPKVLARVRARRYGVTNEALQKMLSDQNNQCAICHVEFSTDAVRSKRATTVHVDHDHLSGMVRGLLCHKCNVGLGLFHDNAESLRNAIKYLERGKDNGEDPVRTAA